MVRSMTNVGKARRFECSLTSQELAEEETRVLENYANKSGKPLDQKYSGIIKDNKVRGYLRCGLPSKSMKSKRGETLRTTVEGEKLIAERQ